MIAGDLSRRYGLVHEVLRLDGLETLSPEEADLRCVQAARRLECMADPLAHAALTFAEAGPSQAPGSAASAARSPEASTTSAPSRRRR